MFDVAAPELVLRLSILLIPLLVLIVLFTLFYHRRSDEHGSQARDVHGNGAEAFLRGTEPGTIAEASNTGNVVAIRARLADAQKSDAPLAVIYLELGRAEMMGGNEQAALEALRSAAGLAARHGPVRVHAEARIELAEAALRAGDPISACEHWQMARMAFLEDGAREEGDKVDKRMRANGCPTDWVLTDF